MDARFPADTRGFFTTRHAFAATEEHAARKVIAKLEHEFTAGASAHIWQAATPRLVIEESQRIGLHQALLSPNRGSTFYDERE
jgi:hypothetical protein